MIIENGKAIVKLLSGVIEEFDYKSYRYVRKGWYGMIEILFNKTTGETVTFTNEDTVGIMIMCPPYRLGNKFALAISGISPVWWPEHESSK